jgi:hypothetical protein
MRDQKASPLTGGTWDDSKVRFNGTVDWGTSVWSLHMDSYSMETVLKGPSREKFSRQPE